MTVQIHFPFPFFKQTTLADGLQEAMDLGLTTAVGVCNYNTAQLEEMHSLLDKKNIPLATNQVHLLWGHSVPMTSYLTCLMSRGKLTLNLLEPGTTLYCLSRCLGIVLPILLQVEQKPSTDSFVLVNLPDV